LAIRKGHFFTINTEQQRLYTPSIISPTVYTFRYVYCIDLVEYH